MIFFIPFSLQVYSFPNPDNAAFALSKTSSDAFDVTFSSGIVYVNDVTKLRKLNSQVNLTIDHTLHPLTLVVNIEGPYRHVDEYLCSKSSNIRLLNVNSIEALFLT